jgi:hypothetical protein
METKEQHVSRAMPENEFNDLFKVNILRYLLYNPVHVVDEHTQYGFVKAAGISRFTRNFVLENYVANYHILFIYIRAKDWKSVKTILSKYITYVANHETNVRKKWPYEYKFMPFSTVRYISMKSEDMTIALLNFITTKCDETLKKEVIELCLMTFALSIMSVDAIADKSNQDIDDGGDDEAYDYSSTNCREITEMAVSMNVSERTMVYVLSTCHSESDMFPVLKILKNPNDVDVIIDKLMFKTNKQHPVLREEVVYDIILNKHMINHRVYDRFLSKLEETTWQQELRCEIDKWSKLVCTIDEKSSNFLLATLQDRDEIPDHYNWLLVTAVSCENYRVISHVCRKRITNISQIDIVPKMKVSLMYLEQIAVKFKGEVGDYLVRVFYDDILKDPNRWFHRVKDLEGFTIIYNMIMKNLDMAMFNYVIKKKNGKTKSYTTFLLGHVWNWYRFNFNVALRYAIAVEPSLLEIMADQLETDNEKIHLMSWKVIKQVSPDINYALYQAICDSE